MNTKWMAATLLAVMVSGSAIAQQKEVEEVTVERQGTKKKNEAVIVEGKKLKKDESIIVRKKGDSKEKITIVVDGEKVVVNGKPIEEFSDENVEIIRSKSRNGYSIATMPRITGTYNFNSNSGYSYSSSTGNKAFLGVTSEKDEKGARVTGITKGSAAEKAGLKKYDIIIKIGETKIENDNSLHEAIGKYKPEDKVLVTYIHDGKEEMVTAVLGKNKSMSFATNGVYWTGKPKIGLQIQDVEEGNGVKVLDVDDETPAAKAGLKENDIIIEVGGKELKNVEEFKTLSKDLKDGDALKIKYKREGKSSTTEIKIPKKLKTANL